MTLRSLDSPLGLYLHIPFCHARCGYCDFVTFTGRDDQIGNYVDLLCREIELQSAKNPRPATTVFFGGGTPSLLEQSHLQKIFKALREGFRIDSGTEVTLEANPESITEVKARGWRAVGVNRVSIGLQAFDDTLLKAMGRLHTVDQFKEAYAAVRRGGFENVNFDLIYGFPGQTLDSWEHTVRCAIALEPEHLSLYSLTIEEHTPFAAAGMKVDNDLQGDMYAWVRPYLPQQGFEQYEVSNFARPGRACRHNLIYWRAQDYVGLGVGAVGCVGNLRWTNQKTLSAYEKDINAGRFPRFSIEPLEPPIRKFENLMLGLRLREGFEWGTEDNPDWLTHRARLAAQGLLEEVNPGRWRIPDSAVHLTNQVLLPFI